MYFILLGNEGNRKVSPLQILEIQVIATPVLFSDSECLEFETSDLIGQSSGAVVIVVNERLHFKFYFHLIIFHQSQNYRLNWLYCFGKKLHHTLLYMCSWQFKVNLYYVES